MHLISINVGNPERVEHRSFRGVTGIHKRPRTGPVAIGVLGIDSDAVVNTRHHGGPDQAIYVYRQEDYDWWTATLGTAVLPGSFGDNLTVAGLPDPGAAIGSRLVFDDVELEVTAPRIPCNTLAARMGDAGFVKRFVAAERPGLYCRVIRPGTLVSGEPFTLAEFAGAAVSTIEIFRGRYRRLETAELQRFLAAPIDQRTRLDYRRELSKRGEPDRTH